MALGLLNALPQVPSVSSLGFNYAIFRKQRDAYASQVRHLRRREYQDMVFSMKQAGLNPMLATGATPGHSAAMQGTPGSSTGGAGIGTAFAANRQAKVAERGVKIDELKAPNEIATEYMRRFDIASQMAQRGANIDLTSATTAKTKAETDLALQQSGTAAIHRALMERQAEREGVTARKLKAEAFQIEKGYNIPPWNYPGADAHNLGGKIGTSAKEMADWAKEHPVVPWDSKWNKIK